MPGKDGVRLTGLALPFEGQPVQGFSGMKAAGDGTYWTLSDNGFGSKLNSTDAMLMLHHVRFDWDAGTVERMETVFLSDPDSVVPFPIVNEASATRYLTGGDFDVESIQPVTGETSCDASSSGVSPCGTRLSCAAASRLIIAGSFRST